MTFQGRTLLSGRAFALLVLCQLVGISALVTPLALLAYGLMLALAAVLLFVDYRTMVRPGIGSLGLRGPSLVELGGEQAFLATFLYAPHVHVWRRPRRLTVTLPEWGCLGLEQPSRTLPLARHEDEGLVCQLRGVKLGTQVLGEAQLSLSSKAQLWRRQEVVPIVGDTVQVVPSGQAVPAQTLMDKAAKQGPLFFGIRQLRRNLGNDQYYTTRPYVFPDSWRSIDHKKSARYGQWMTRTYEAYRQHHLVILCDFGRVMLGTQAGSAKLAFYLAAAQKLASSALASRDTVSFCGFHQAPVALLRQARSVQALGELWQRNEPFTASEEESNYELIPRLMQQLSAQRALVVLLTDVNRPSVQQSLLTVLPQVCRKHATVAVGLLDETYSMENRIETLPDVALTEDSFSDWERAEFIYSYWLGGEFARFQEKMLRLGGATFTGGERHWLDLVTRVYALLRQSPQA